MNLIPGDGNPHHSRILWWSTESSTFNGKEWGWQAQSLDCSASFSSSISVSDLGIGSSGANIFCAGHAQLEDGRLLVPGGTDPVTGAYGENKTRLYTPGTATTTGTWSNSNNMAKWRWYPTATSLRDGRILVLSGATHPHLRFFGGRRDGAASAAPTGDSLYRFAPIAGGRWDRSVFPDADGANGRPAPRENHSAVEMGNVTGFEGQIIFGGIGSSGSTLNDSWILLNAYPALADDDRYLWRKINPTNPGPFRSGHVAVQALGNAMVVHGGLDDNGVAQSNVRRLFRVLNSYDWSIMNISGAGPSARYQHTAIYDTGTVFISGIPTQLQRMIVFGGTSAPAQTPTDLRLWELRFNPASPNDATWSELTQVDLGGPKPGPRSGHSLNLDGYIRDQAPTKRGHAALMYGGDLGNSAYSDSLWKLWLFQDGTAGWEFKGVGGAIRPGQRARHSATYDNEQGNGNGRLHIFGGVISSGQPADKYDYVADVWTSGNWLQWDDAEFSLSGHTALINRNTFPERAAEVFDPSGLSWHVQNSTLLQHTYPVTFVVPGGTAAGGRVVTLARNDSTYWLDIPSTGQAGAWQRMTNAYTGFTPEAGVLYRPGRLMAAGGRLAGVATKTTKTLDTSNLNNGWVDSDDMALTRHFHNLVLLPNGKVLAVGGLRTLGQTDNDTPAKRPQIWDPDANAGIGAWDDTTLSTRLASQPTTRNYHSTAILLPDGRVLSGGGENPDRAKFDIFCPPYLYEADGTTLADRPTISGAPDTVSTGGRFTICTPEAQTASSACLIRPGATTHSFDENQRFIPLTILNRCDQQQQLIVSSPADAGAAPPGYYLLFILSQSGVPSIARWVWVLPTSGWDTCDNSAPAQVGSPAVSNVGYKSATLTWTSPGDDVNCGEAQVTEVRMSTSAITEANWLSPSTSLKATLIPGPNGTSHCLEVDWSGAGCSRHFAFRTRDDRYRWSEITDILVTGDCSAFEIPVCDGGGLLAGGGGGGGEESAQQLNLAATGSVSGLAGSEETGENSVLWPGVASEIVDLHRLGGSPEGSDGQYTVRLRQAGTWRAVIDQLSIGVVDHDPAITAIAGTDRVLLGTLEPVTSVTDAMGGEMARLQGETSDPPFVGKAGEHVLIRLEGASASTALVLESRGAAARAGDDLGGILVQTPGADRNWATIAEVQPRRKFDRCAVATGGSESVRLVFQRDCALRSLVRLNVTETVAPQPLELTGADHSSLGGVGEAIRESGGTATSLAPGEALSLEFTPIEKDLEKVRDYFLLARGSFEPARDQGSTELSGASAAAAWVFGVSPARPNPSFGTASIDYTLAHKVQVELLLYDVAGRLVRTLVNRELPAGPQSADWDGRDDRGRRVGGGVYFYRLVAGDWHSERKLILLQR